MAKSICPPKKVITQDFESGCATDIGNVNFIPSRYEQAILNKGYNVWKERALRCPCSGKSNPQPLVSCLNCGGTGWFFINRTATKALVQSFGTKIKNEEWSSSNIDTIMISVRKEDRLSYMDKFTILDLEADFSQLVFPNKYKNETMLCYTTYNILDVLYLYKYNGDNVKLIPLIKKVEGLVDWDYTFEVGSKTLIFNYEKYKNESGISMAVAYRHHPVFHVIEILREYFRTPVNECNPELWNALGDMPLHASARRAHQTEVCNFNGIHILDNTLYPDEMPPQKIC